MKLMIDPMPALKAQAELRINTYFVEHHKNIDYLRGIWTRKRSIAELVLEGNEAPQTFLDEAKLRNLSVEDFAQLIMSKSDTIADIDALELRRQKIMLEITSATKPEQIKVIEERDPREILHG